MRKWIIALTVLVILLAGTTALAGPCTGGGLLGPVTGGGLLGPVTGGGLL